MASSKKRLIITGDKELTRMLNSLERKLARKLHRTAARKAAKLVLDAAKSLVPRKTGAYSRSLTVRAIKRSRRYQGYNVTQRLNYAKKGQRGRQSYYGVFQELGWKAGGKPRGIHGASDMPLENLIAATKKNLAKTTRQPKGQTKVEGKWMLRKAGVVKEPAAIRLYHEELEALLKAEAKG